VGGYVGSADPQSAFTDTGEAYFDRIFHAVEELAVALIRKIARQAGKDYVLFPALSRRRWRRTLTANAAANLLRNVWAYVVICCGHFADGAEKFTAAALDGETKPEWYLRQMLGTANFRAGPVLAFLSGNLCYQIEHHLYPDLLRLIRTAHSVFSYFGALRPGV
jgi:fatty acid desaturase